MEHLDTHKRYMKHIKLFENFESPSEPESQNTDKICVIRCIAAADYDSDVLRRYFTVAKSSTLEKAIKLAVGSQELEDGTFLRYFNIFYPGDDAEEKQKLQEELVKLSSCISSSDPEKALTTFLIELWEEYNYRKYVEKIEVGIFDVKRHSENGIAGINTLRKTQYKPLLSPSYEYKDFVETFVGEIPDDLERSISAYTGGNSVISFMEK
jgi:hypothetical protein